MQPKPCFETKIYRHSFPEEHNDDIDESKSVSLNQSDDTNLNDTDAEVQQVDDDTPGEVQQEVQQPVLPLLKTKLKLVTPPFKKLEEVNSTTHSFSVITGE